MNDNIHQMPTKPDEAKALLEMLTREMPALIARTNLMAQLRRANYLALVKEGFTPQEALTLVAGNPFL